MGARREFKTEHPHITDAMYTDLKAAIGDDWSALDDGEKLVRLNEEYTKRPHMLPKAAEKNPWSAQHWNVSAQGAVAITHGTDKANEIAAEVGCKIGSTKPNPLYAKGEQEKSAETDKRRKDHANNPFHRSAWNVTKQGALIKTLGLDKANAIAKSVGSHVGATRPNSDF